MTYVLESDYKLCLPPLLDPALTDCYKNREMMRHIPKMANIKMIKDVQNNSFCFNYVFGNEVDNCDDAQEILEAIYEPIPLREVKANDIVAYYDNEYGAVHFGFVQDTDGTPEGIRIISKWGQYGIFQSDLKTVPEAYGDYVVFWRKKGQ